MHVNREILPVSRLASRFFLPSNPWKVVSNLENSAKFSRRFVPIEGRERIDSRTITKRGGKRKEAFVNHSFQIAFDSTTLRLKQRYTLGSRIIEEINYGRLELSDLLASPSLNVRFLVHLRILRSLF